MKMPRQRLRPSPKLRIESAVAVDVKPVKGSRTRSVDWLHALRRYDPQLGKSLLEVCSEKGISETRDPRAGAKPRRADPA